MADIFGRNVTTANAQGLSADTAILTITGVNSTAALPLLAQNFNIGYQQPITMVFDLSSNGVAFVRGRSRGSMSLATIIGPVQVSSTFLAKYGSVCGLAKGDQNIGLTFPQGCTDAPGTNSTLGTWGLIAKNVVIEQVQFTAVVDNMLITSNYQMMFSSLE